MNLDELLPAGGIDALAGQLGISREQAASGAAALLPSVLSGMGGMAGALPGGAGGAAGGLESILQGLGGGQLADNVVGPEPTDVGKGNEILGHIFGSKQVSRDVAGQAAQTSGLDPAVLRKMLPILAMLAAGFLAKRSAGQQRGLGGILGSVLGSLGGGSAGGLGGGLGGLGGILGSVLGGQR
ncbi:MAG: DUF937 domain-containing protein [Croceibacterium sp.]